MDRNSRLSLLHICPPTHRVSFQKYSRRGPAIDSRIRGLVYHIPISRCKFKHSRGCVCRSASGLTGWGTHYHSRMIRGGKARCSMSGSQIRLLTQITLRKEACCPCDMALILSVALVAGPLNFRKEVSFAQAPADAYTGKACDALLMQSHLQYDAPGAEFEQINRTAIFSLVGPELSLVEEEFERQVSHGPEIVSSIGRYLREGGGKRVRPALLLLAAKAVCGSAGSSAVRMATVMEMLHTATLVHYDVIDEARVRRGRPSVNATWGNDITVLMGDWLYM